MLKKIKITVENVIERKFNEKMKYVESEQKCSGKALKTH